MTVFYGIMSPAYPGNWVTEAIDIRLNGGTTQVLAKGLYNCIPYTDAYALTGWNNSFGHLQVLAGGVWRSFMAIAGFTISDGIFYSDGITLRFANGAAAGTWYRLVGVRMY